MAIESKKIVTVKSLPGQVLQELPDTDTRTADGFKILSGVSGKKYEDIGGRTSYNSIADIRAMGANGIPDANANITYITNDFEVPGYWKVDTNDTTSADNAGTILVTAAGARVKRQFDGAVNMEWFDVRHWREDSSYDNYASMKAAIDTAISLNKDVILQKGGRFYCSGTLVLEGETTGGIAQAMSLILGKGTEIATKTDGQILIRAGYNSRIIGGRLFLTNLNSVGVFYWGGDPVGAPGNFTGIEGTLIGAFNPATLNQRGVVMAIGCESDLTPIASSSGQSLAFITIRARFSNVALGVDMIDLATTTKAGYINSVIIESSFNGLAAVKTIGTQHKITGMFQPSWATPFADKDKYFVWQNTDDNGNYNEVNIKVWDWFGRGPAGKMAVTNYGTGNTFHLGSLRYSDIEDHGAATRFVSVRELSGYNNQSQLLGPNTYSYYKYLGNQSDALFYAHKKYNVTFTGTWDTSGDFTSTPETMFFDGVGIRTSGATQSNPFVITINKSDSSFLFQSLQYVCLDFRTFPDYIKIEYYDNTNWITLHEMEMPGPVRFNTNNYDTEFNKTLVYGLRVTMYSASGQFVIERFHAYIQKNNNTIPETYLPVGGGNLYGDVVFKTLTSAKFLGTDANGKLIAITPTIRTITASDTQQASDSLVIIEATSEDVTFTLLAASKKKPIQIKNKTTSTKTVTIKGDGSTNIDDSNTYTLPSGSAVKIDSDGTQYYITSLYNY